MKWLKLQFSVLFLSDLTAVPLLNVSYLAANGGNPTTQRHIICKHTQGSNLDLFGHYGKIHWTPHNFLYVYMYYVYLNNVRIFHGYELRIEKSVRGSLFGITRLSCIPFHLQHLILTESPLTSLVPIQLCPPYWKLKSYVMSQWHQLPMLNTNVLTTGVVIHFFFYPMGRIRSCKTRYLSALVKIAAKIVWYARIILPQ